MVGHERLRQPGMLDDLGNGLLVAADGKKNAKPVLVSEALADGGNRFDEHIQKNRPSNRKMDKRLSTYRLCETSIPKKNNLSPQQIL
jgi:hypothetical protein